ncbi:MAG TPA: bifunctional DNA-formamidopyrimidine glycosylase/DNA-(apurinic or apyrimidinic site) lyase [Caulobacteraceae bacterium]|nr:bifunctional DNA-formamidopyrimidine glycosylase/DNA-(apurinic or apyrimidinic site) lyase [Caulobacteraceae bacterium]
MPELPEVEVVRRGLERALTGARFRSVRTRRADLRFPFPDRFAERVTGARAEAPERRGKHIIVPLDTGWAIIIHLGMTGRFLVGKASADEGGEGKHAHVVFDTDRGDRITFFDARRFGSMDLVERGDLQIHARLKDLGADPLAAGFGAGSLAAALAGRKRPIKAALLDQRLIAGLGNIYVCEALHRARISPLRPSARISRARIQRLVEAIRSVLDEAIAAGGSTLKDYAAADGELGYFQHSFRVYGREGQRCLEPSCGATVRRIVQSGRSSFYCPSCQH